MTTIDLNCDLGEGAGHDDELLSLISSANVACGAHAGDAATIRAAVSGAERHNVVIGAHPGYADREHFGRRELELDPTALRESLRDQITVLRTEAPNVAYVKPHGALYNQAARDARLAALVVDVVRAFERPLGLLAPAGSELWRAGEAAGLTLRAEVFADRAYDAVGRLVPRGAPGAMIEDEAVAVAQVLDMVRDGRVRSLTGEWVSVQADSICVHGDNPQAVAFVRRLWEALEAEGIAIRSCWEVAS